MTNPSPYLQALTDAMTELARPADAVVLGQAVAHPGTAMFHTFANVPPSRLLETPVFEDTQLGMAIGLSLAGHHPVLTVYPRINFLLLAMNQLVLHLDALPRYSDYRPRVIVRTAVAHDQPLDPGPQHLGDYSPEIAACLRQVRVVRLERVDQVIPAYRAAADPTTPGSTLLVEYARLYDA